MRNLMMSGLVILLLLGVSETTAAEPAGWTQLSLGTCAVDRFLADRPDSDGRGVVIAVMDTGVDPSIPGLTRTPDGGVKVIDVQDFSGEGDTELHRARRDPQNGNLITHDSEGVEIGYALPDLPASEEPRRFWFGWLEEKRFVNSDVSDLNDNGKKDDRFGICVTALAGDGDDQAVCYVDTDLDRSFADEKPLRNYKLAFDTFNLHRATPEKQIIPATFAVNIFLRQSKVVFHFDDGAHGTHVAGIAAGYRINDQDGFHGVAPGAKVISLKIGNNAIGGVSTSEAKKKALEYAARFARESGMPVVCNLSYGVESTIEGQSAIDKFYDEFLTAHPYVVFCTSGGNEGPGLSTMGTPSAARAAISVAAMMAADTGRDVRGFEMDDAVVTVFSSRGGELDKPDIAVPGWSTSTVPRYVRNGDFWAGTSMASPYAAGMCALMISDVLSGDAGARVRAVDVKRALQLSAKPPAHGTTLDFGAGVPNLPRAVKLLREIADETGDDPVLDYAISTRSPHGPDGKSGAAYWRSTWFPKQERQTFVVKPIFAPGADENARTQFTRKFTLRSRANWCRCPQKSFYLRSAQAADVHVEYDASRLKDPGLHVGIVEALHDGKVAMRFVNTVIVPHVPTAEDGFALKFEGEQVEGWQPRRFFVAVPPGAGGMRAVLSAPDGVKSKASIERIFDPRGFQQRIRSHKLDTDQGKREVVWSVTDELVPGVWELDVVSDRPDRTWPFDLHVRFFGLQAAPSRITTCASPDDKPAGDLIVTNQFHTPLAADVDGVIEGFRMHKQDEFVGLNDEVSYAVTLGENMRGLRLDLEFTPEAWAEHTDVGVAVEDQSGKALLLSGFDNNDFAATVKHPAPGSAAKLTVKIRAGFAVHDDKRKTPITVNLDHLLADPVPLKVTWGDSSRVDFVPGVPIKLEFKAERGLPKAPSGTQPVGYLHAKERSSGQAALRVPIELE
jgi:tripeptidyl-peptidase-2